MSGTIKLLFSQMNQTRTEAAAAEHGLSLLNLKLGLAKVSPSATPSFNYLNNYLFDDFISSAKLHFLYFELISEFAC